MDYHGVYAILYAFFTASGQLDRGLMKQQVEACLASGAHGLAALGLATEVNKLSTTEREQIMDWICTDVAGRVPVALTIAGASVSEQTALIRQAEAAGASWLILQPPGRDISNPALLDFFAEVMASTRLPCAIQNAPAYLGVGLEADELHALCQLAANFKLLKGEGPALEIQQQIEAVGSALQVFNGRGGLEFPDNLRAGCAGLIPAPDAVDRLVPLYEAFRRGDEADAERIYAEVLPCITFVMQSIATLLCYGKRIVAWRLGVDTVYDRQPALAPTRFGLECAKRYADQLGPFPGNHTMR